MNISLSTELQFTNLLLWKETFDAKCKKSLLHNEVWSFFSTPKFFVRWNNHDIFTSVHHANAETKESFPLSPRSSKILPVFWKMKKKHMIFYKFCIQANKSLSYLPYLFAYHIYINTISQKATLQISKASK